MKLQIIGGGNMGAALLGGVLSSGWVEARDVVVVELDEQRRADLADMYDELNTSGEVSADVDSVLAVKPQHVPEVLAKITGDGVRVLSIAAGVRISKMEQAAPTAHIVRAMPNTPSVVGQGASAIAGGTLATEDDLDWAESILGAVGLVERVSEAELDAVTGLSGSGPAYVFHFAEAMIAAGVAQGLPHDVADRLARQTILGAATLLTDSNEDPAVLRENVTSPNGTTAAGLAVLGEADLMQLIAEAVAAATSRSVELGS